MSQTINVPAWPSPIFALGNADILSLPKTAFLCSRRVPAGAILEIYKWAQQVRTDGVCVLSGFHSVLERDVLKILLAGKQPLILAAARGLPKRLPPELDTALTAKRLLILSPFAANIARPSAKRAECRNSLMLQLAERVIIGHAAPNGQLSALLAQMPPTKNITFLG